MTAVGDIRAGGCLNLNQPGKVVQATYTAGVKTRRNMVPFTVDDGGARGGRSPQAGLDPLPECSGG